MIDQTPPEMMSIEDRLNEVASLMMRGVERLKKRSGEGNFREYLAGLKRERKHSWDKESEQKIK